LWAPGAAENVRIFAAAMDFRCVSGKIGVGY
jgi:hypothetical protein